VTLADRRARGENDAQVLAWLASSAGLAEPGEPVSARELVERFDPERVASEPTTFG
jgi:glutamyl-tRNA synthetase